MKKTAVTSCVLFLFVCSQLLVDGMVKMPQNGRFKRLYRDGNLKDVSGFVPTNNVKNMLQRDQEFRRNICLSARELDCERELQDQ
ncbi:hypothetical protein ACROYT_G025211 [Oculina patagonica]